MLRPRSPTLLASNYMQSASAVTFTTRVAPYIVADPTTCSRDTKRERLAIQSEITGRDQRQSLSQSAHRPLRPCHHNFQRETEREREHLHIVARDRSILVINDVVVIIIKVVHHSSFVVRCSPFMFAQADDWLPGR